MTTDERRGKPSASGMADYARCPGRVNICNTIEVEDKPRSYTTDGDAIHSALAGETKTEDLTPDQRAKAAKLMRSRDVLQARFGEDAKWISEERFWSEKEDYSGRFDLVGIKGRRAIVIDYKSGYQEVAEASRNLQLRCGVALLKQFDPDLNEISAAVVQVNRPITLTTYEVEDIDDAIAQIQLVVNDTKAETAPRRPGTSQCQFCPAATAGACPEHQAYATSALKEGAVESALAVAWTPEQWAIFCERAPEARKWLDQRAEDARNILANDPDAIPGWFLKPGAVVEKIDPFVLEYLVESGYDWKRLMEAVSVSKSKLRRLLGELSDTKGKDLTNLFWKAAGAYITTKRNQPSLAKK